MTVVETRRTLVLKNRWLLFNWGSFCGDFYYRRDALDAMRSSLGDDFHKWRDYYDLVRGDVKVMTPAGFRVHVRRKKEAK